MNTLSVAKDIIINIRNLFDTPEFIEVHRDFGYFVGKRKLLIIFSRCIQTGFIKSTTVNSSFSFKGLFGFSVDHFYQSIDSSKKLRKLYTWI